MKTLLIITISFMSLFLLNGCATWEGVKHDSKEVWKGTKKTIHNATAD